MTAYGERYPFGDLCQVMVRGSSVVLISVHDEGVRENVMKAVNNSGLEVACTLEGKNIQVKLLATTAENKKEYLAKAKRLEAGAKERVKDLRHGMLAKSRKLEKLIGQDEARRFSGDVESAVKKGAQQVEKVLAAKEKEISKA